MKVYRLTNDPFVGSSWDQDDVLSDVILVGEEDRIFFGCLSVDEVKGWDFIGGTGKDLYEVEVSESDVFMKVCGGEGYRLISLVDWKMMSLRDQGRYVVMEEVVFISRHIDQWVKV